MPGLELYAGEMPAATSGSNNPIDREDHGCRVDRGLAEIVAHRVSKRIGRRLAQQQTVEGAVGVVIKRAVGVDREERTRG